jgi:hypothetical protein
MLGLLNDLFAQLAQPVQRCHAHEYDQIMTSRHPEALQTRQQIFDNAEQNAVTETNNLRTRSVVVIPVVFHVVYKNSSENVSSQRILEQLQIMNEDFGGYNPDRVKVPAVWAGLVANTEIQFCLAKRDPNNNWTNGVVRVSTTTQSFDLQSDNVKSNSTGGDDTWDASRYLNIWVCDIYGPILGYAQLPGLPAATDGVVIDYLYVGKTGASAPFNRGRTATHELGHWLGLQHIWADDGGSCASSDGVSDTPNQADENYNCYAVGQVLTDACSPTSPGVMWMNYMDYTDDACMYMFTKGQKSVMWSTLNGVRSSLLNSNACTPVGVAEYQQLSPVNIFPTVSSGRVTVDFGFLEKPEVDVQLFNALGQQVFTQRYALTSESRIELELEGFASGVYTVLFINGEARASRKLVIQ